MNNIEQAKALVKETFITIFNNKQCDEKTISHYLAPKFTLYVNGNVKHYPELVRQFQRDVQTYKSMNIKFIEMIAEDNKVASSHVMEIVTQEDIKLIWQGQAIFYIDDGKLTRGIETIQQIEKSYHDAILKESSL